MKDLRISNFRNYRLDVTSQIYRADVDVAGKRGLFRRDCSRTEPIIRYPGSATWVFDRTKQVAPIEVWDLEQEHRKTLFVVPQLNY